MQTLGVILFYVLPILAILPVFMPWWRWFLASVLTFLASAILFNHLAVEDISSQTSGEGPAIFGLMLYLMFIGIIFLFSVVVKITIVICSRK